MYFVGCLRCPRTESETRQIYDTDDLFVADISQLLSICSIVYNCRIEILSDIFGVLHICINENASGILLSEKYVIFVPVLLNI